MTAPLETTALDVVWIGAANG
jgi:hypothetical protein